MRASVVIPAYNEAGNIGALVRETYAVVPAQNLVEVIVVDDGSSDETGAEVKALIGTLPGLRYLRHARRCGQSTALRTGILAASSTIVATMDGDGQNDPRDLVRLLARLAPPGSPASGPGCPKGPAMVSGVRTQRIADGAKIRASRFANWLRNVLLKDACPDSGCGIKVYWREAFLRLPFFSNIHRFLPALFQITGHEVAYVAVTDRRRMAGVSKYSNLDRALLGITDLLGVCWLRRRTRVPTIDEDVVDGRQVRTFIGRPLRRVEAVHKGQTGGGHSGGQGGFGGPGDPA